MIYSNPLVYFLCAPEIFSAVALIFPAPRKWLMKMIEDSDGDPHHTDGFFIAVLYCAIWCFRIGFIGAYMMIVYDKELLSLIITMMTFGCTLLGVRMAKNKMDFNLFNKPKQ